MLPYLKRLGLGMALLLAFLAPPPLHGQSLRVALFPYLPDVAHDDLKALRAGIVDRFKTAHPAIDLVLEIDPQVDPYSLATLGPWLKPGGKYDVVEIDAVLLGEVADSGWIQPWGDLKDTRWGPGVTQAVTYKDQAYGIPHWLCSDFIITRDPGVAGAHTLGDLIKALGPAPITGAVNGSWTLPALYLHAVADTRGAGAMAGAISSATLEADAVQHLGDLLRKCRIGDKNPCLTKETGWAGAVFASGGANTLIGYSERLTSLIQLGVDPSTLRLSKLPLGSGAGDPPQVLYVDALVRRKDCDETCQKASDAFAEFLLQDATYQFILTSQDVPAQPAVPRYLIPATESAFTVNGVMGDRLFDQIREASKDGVSIPNKGLYDVRKTMQEHLLEALKKQIEAPL